MARWRLRRLRATAQKEEADFNNYANDDAARRWFAMRPTGSFVPARLRPHCPENLGGGARRAGATETTKFGAVPGRSGLRENARTT